MSFIFVDAPDVTIVYENYTVNAKSRKLVCLPKGVPANYTFFQWQHKSEYGDHIRFLDGSEDGILLLPKSKDFNSQYYDNGVYVCTVSNGIPGVSGNSKRTASVHLSISGMTIRKISQTIINSNIEKRSKTSVPKLLRSSPLLKLQ